jgi:F-type H+-transporting ATPase subunit epsilon
MATINVDIVSAEGEIFSGEAAMVFAPAKMGEVGIAPRHAPLLTALKPGEVRVQDTEGKEHFFYITGGMLEVQPHAVMVLADTALRGDQLDEAAALAARDEAAKALEGVSAETDVAKAQAELAEAEARYRASARKISRESLYRLRPRCCRQVRLVRRVTAPFSFHLTWPPCTAD